MGTDPHGISLPLLPCLHLPSPRSEKWAGEYSSELSLSEGPVPYKYTRDNSAEANQRCTFLSLLQVTAIILISDHEFINDYQYYKTTLGLCLIDPT